MSDEFPVYGRELLLLGAKRNAVLDLWEVPRYGSDSYGDIDYVSVYGMRPADWHAKGARLLGRTAVECTRDRLGNAIGKEVAAIAGPRPPGARAQVVDRFPGCGNTLYCCCTYRARGASGSSRMLQFSGSLGTISQLWPCPSTS